VSRPKIRAARRSESRLRTGLAILSPVTLIFLLLTSGCGGSDTPAATAPVIAVTVRAVSASQDSNAGVYTATFKPGQEVAVAFKASGYVDSIKQVLGADGRMRDIQGGDFVEAHDQLASIKCDVYQAQLNQISSALAGAKAELVRAHGDFNRDSQLMEVKVLSRATYDSAVQQFQSAKSAVQQQEAALREAEINFGYCKLASPIDGTVLDRRIEIGSLAQQNTVAFQVADTSEMKAVFGVSDIAVAQLRPGQSQTLHSDALSAALVRGKITRIAPNADPTTRVFDVEVTVPNRDGKLRTGMIASLQIAESQPRSVERATLPLNSIVRPPGRLESYGVFVVQQSSGKTIARLRDVQLGEIIGNEVAVLSGVKSGELVVLRGATMLSDRSEVRVIP
jgi:RND family efflux transporter MFP subunit